MFNSGANSIIATTKSVDFSPLLNKKKKAYLSTIAKLLSRMPSSLSRPKSYNLTTPAFTL